LRYKARNDNELMCGATDMCGRIAASQIGRHGLLASLVPKSTRRNDGNANHRNKSCSKLYSQLPLWMDMRAHRLVKLGNPPPPNVLPIPKSYELDGDVAGDAKRSASIGG